MSEPCPPLTPPDCDLRDFPYMPLDVVRLRDSDISAIVSGDEFRCAVLMWCASWHQVPAASLPDEDVVLAQLAGFGRVVREWKRVRVGALRGWIKCSDARLYHPVVAEKANEAWAAKLTQRWRTECARIKKMNQRQGTDMPFPELASFLSLPPALCPPGHGVQGRGKERGIYADWDPAAAGAGAGRAAVADDASPPPLSPSPCPSPPASRALELALLLRAQGAAVAPANPQVLDWAARGVSDAQALQALDVARRRRAAAGSQQPINAGFLDSILSGEVLQGKSAKPSRHHGIGATDFREGVSDDGRF
ncbi:DUF1376 domain-containing protein [Verminephrobacter aporrectodeae subsp. tuberculatae]|uniref:YdaU family protein n=1 Tax=Verminephrobacter aporrectodeae TaxID=1110389 RepID=UPI0022389348|nr:YdaU family protein [Verminephrobacter aporrectodeae]MCW5257377.1 DUF1376 domain-containing protein [Verminephrobacter aporrectodeae subsp. tuberculatae]